MPIQRPAWFNSRVLSALIAIAYLGYAVHTSDVELFLTLFLFLLVPVVCIWFPEVMGDYVGYGLGTVGVTKESPAGCVWLVGWVVLLLPLLMVAIVWLRS